MNANKTDSSEHKYCKGLVKQLRVFFFLFLLHLKITYTPLHNHLYLGVISNNQAN